MRLRLPLNGFKFCQGHPMFHFALFAASFISVDTQRLQVDSVQFFRSKYEDDYDSHASYGDDVTFLIDSIRYVHLVIGCSQLVGYYLASHGDEFALLG